MLLRHEPPERDHGSPVVEVSSDQRKVVLVVDDEEQVRNLTRRILERPGYRVLMAGDGPEALAISRGYPGKIHLLLTDVEMNAMSGFELSHRMIAERPNIRVLLYSANPAYAGQTEFPFLAKPFVPEQLQIAVGRALESQAETAAPADLELIEHRPTGEQLDAGVAWVGQETAATGGAGVNHHIG